MWKGQLPDVRPLQGRQGRCSDPASIVPLEKPGSYAPCRSTQPTSGSIGGPPRVPSLGLENRLAGVTLPTDPDPTFVRTVDVEHGPKPVADVTKQALSLFVSISVVAAAGTERRGLHQAARRGEARFAG